MSRRADQIRLSWNTDGRDWPNREYSQFVRAFGLLWHVQRMGQGPPLLLLHGTGAATHSWRALAPLLAKHFSVTAPDLPGHGFTDPMVPGTLSLPGMASAVRALLERLGMQPAVVVGHSAGAAILARLCIDRGIAPKLLISLNGALLPFEGMAGHIFPSIAKLLFLNPFAPRLFAWSADRSAVARLLHGIGSTIEAKGVELYARLLSNPAHVAGALGMMANWDLEALHRDLPKLNVPIALVAARDDTAVPPEAARKIKARVPRGEIERLVGVGHLAHEERPEAICDLILRLSAAADVIPSTARGPLCA